MCAGWGGGESGRQQPLCAHRDEGVSELEVSCPSSSLFSLSSSSSWTLLTARGLVLPASTQQPLRHPQHYTTAPPRPRNIGLHTRPPFKTRTYLDVLAGVFTALGSLCRLRMLTVEKASDSSSVPPATADQQKLNTGQPSPWDTSILYVLDGEE